MEVALGNVLVSDMRRYSRLIVLDESNNYVKKLFSTRRKLNQHLAYKPAPREHTKKLLRSFFLRGAVRPSAV